MKSQLEAFTETLRAVADDEGYGAAAGVAHTAIDAMVVTDRALWFNLGWEAALAARDGDGDEDGHA